LCPTCQTNASRPARRARPSGGHVVRLLIDWPVTTLSKIHLPPAHHSHVQRSITHSLFHSRLKTHLFLEMHDEIFHFEIYIYINFMKILKYFKTHFLKYFMKLLIFNIKWLKTFKNMIKVYQVSRRYIMIFMHNNKYCLELVYLLCCSELSHCRLWPPVKFKPLNRLSQHLSQLITSTRGTFVPSLIKNLFTGGGTSGQIGEM